MLYVPFNLILSLKLFFETIFSCSLTPREELESTAPISLADRNRPHNPSHQLRILGLMHSASGSDLLANECHRFVSLPQHQRAK